MTNTLIEKYAPKYAKDLVLDIHHDIDGYDIILVDGYYFTDTDTTMRIEETVADLKKVFKFIEKIEETVDAVEETVETVDAVETVEETVETATPDAEAVDVFEGVISYTGYFVEMIHDDDYIGSFEMDEILDLEDIAQYHATVYVAGKEIVYQIFINEVGSYIGDIKYSFDGKKATKLK